jgi:type I restriction enzyme S subunit
MNSISQSTLGILSCCCPTLTEQKEIADYLDRKCDEIDRLIEIKGRKIEKLKEYKKSLIYEYVTGKKEI